MISEADARRLADAFYAKMGISRIAIDSLLLYTALVVKKVMLPVVIIEPGTVPANTTVTVTDLVPTDFVDVLTEIRFFVEQDHAVSYVYSVDNGSLTFSDTDVVQRVYDTPINFPAEAAQPVARQQIQLTVTNKTDNPVYLTSIDIRGRINAKVWDSLEENFFSEIAAAIPGLGVGSK